MYKEILKLAWPVVVQNLLMTLTMYVDTFMLGWYNQTALAALGICRPILMAIRLVLMALAVGTLATVARAFGEGNPEKTRKQAISALWSAFVIGTVISLGGVIFLGSVVDIYIDSSTQPELAHATRLYLQIVISAFVFSYIFIVVSSIFRACGNTTGPLLIAIYANLFKIVGNYCLIYGRLGFPELGIAGAALTTALSDLITGLLILFLIFSKSSVIHLRLPDLVKINWANLKTLLRVSLPAAAEPVFIQAGILIIYKLIAELGEIAIASQQVVISIESLSFMPGMGFSMACGALVGQNLGAHQIDRAETAYRASLLITLLIMSFFSILFVTLPTNLARIFISQNESPEVVNLSALCLTICAIEQPFIAMSMIHQGTLRGAGDTKSPLYVAFIGVWLVRVPAAYIFTKKFNWELPGIWTAFVVDWIVRTIAFRIFYLKGRWKQVPL